MAGRSTPTTRCIAGLNDGLRREPYGAEFRPAAATIIAVK
jgi:hypothetical protein